MATRGREGRQEAARKGGELRGRVQIIDGFVARDAPGRSSKLPPESTRPPFDRLKRQVDAADGGATPAT